MLRFVVQTAQDDVTEGVVSSESRLSPMMSVVNIFNIEPGTMDRIMK